MATKTYTLTIETGNDAFGSSVGERNSEVARILREAADRIERGDHYGDFTLRDYNGNRVGACVS